MADKRLNIILTVTDKGTVKVEKSSKAIKNLEVQGTKSSKRLGVAFAKVAIAVAAAFATDRLIAFGNQAITTADKVAKTAAKIGLATDALQELRFAAARSGVETTALDMGLQRFTRRVAEAVQGSGELKGTLDQYNIAVKNADGSTRDTVDVLGDLADVIQAVESDSERLRISFKAFDSEGAALVNALRGGSEGLAELRAQAHETGNVIDADLLVNFEAARDAIDTAAGTLRTSWINAVGDSTVEIKLLADEIGKLARDDQFKEFLSDTIRLGTDLAKVLVSLPIAIADIARALSGEVTPLQAMQEALIADAEASGILDDRKFLGAWTLSVEGLLEEIKNRAPDLFAKHGIDPLTMLPTEPASASPSSGGGAAAIADTSAADAAILQRLVWMQQKHSQFFQARQQEREEFAKEAVKTNDAMVEEINAGELLSLEFSRGIVKAREELEGELARQRSEALGEYVDSWQFAEEERAAAAIRAGDIIAEHELEQTQATADAQEEMLQTVRQKIEEVGAAIGASVAQIVVYGKSASEVFANLFKSLAAQVIQYLIKATIQYIAEQIIQLQIAAAAFTTKSAQNVSLAATTAAAAAAAGTPIAMAAAAAAASAATIAAGTLAYTTAVGAFSAIGQVGGVAHGGLDFVPRESTFLLDKGERVLSPRQNKDFTSFLDEDDNRGGAMSGDVYLEEAGVVERIGRVLYNGARDGRNKLAIQGIG